MSVSVPEADSPGKPPEAANVRAEMRAKGRTATVAVFWTGPSVAVIVTLASEALAGAVAVTDACQAPSGTVIVAGTTRAAGRDEAREIVFPPDGATETNETATVAEPPAVTVPGNAETAERPAGGNTLSWVFRTELPTVAVKVIVA